MASSEITTKDPTELKAEANAGASTYVHDRSNISTAKLSDEVGGNVLLSATVVLKTSRLGTAPDVAK
jgi:hypothetical protein